MVIDSEQWHRLSAVVAAFVTADLRIGFGTNERARVFNHSVSYSHDDHELISFRRLLEPLIGTETQPLFDKPFLHIRPICSQRSEKNMKSRNSHS